MSTLLEVAFYVPGSSGETGDVLLSEIKHKFAEMCSKEGWILDGIGIKKAPVENTEKNLDLTQSSSSWCQMQPLTNEPITVETSATLLKKAGPMSLLPAKEPSTNNCQKSVQRPYISYIYTEPENREPRSSISEISEKLKISEDSLRAIKEMLVCGFCMEVVKRPHTLVCGHSFCTHCISKWKQEQKYNRRKPFCPVCSVCFPSTRRLLENSKGATSNLQKYPKNWMLAKVAQVFTLDKVSSDEEQRCELLEREAPMDSSSSDVEDSDTGNFQGEMEQTESILFPLLISIVAICIFVLMSYCCLPKKLGPQTSPS